MERPFMQCTGDQIRQLIDALWDDFETLGALAYELQYRSHIGEDRRAAVIERLVALGRQGVRVISVRRSLLALARLVHRITPDIERDGMAHLIRTRVAFNRKPGRIAATA